MEFLELEILKNSPVKEVSVKSSPETVLDLISELGKAVNDLLRYPSSFCLSGGPKG